jgi:hypothetical protein
MKNQRSQIQAILGVHIQDMNGRTPRRGAPNDVCTLQLEVIIPILFSGMEKRNHLSGTGVKASEICSFASITFATGKRQIRHVFSSIVFLCDDMLDMEP